MTGHQFKEHLLEAVQAFQSGEIPIQLLEDPESDTREALNVLTEALPGASAVQLAQVLEDGDPYSKAEMQQQWNRVQKAETDSSRQKEMAQFLNMSLSLLNNSAVIDLSPSSHYNS